MTITKTILRSIVCALTLLAVLFAGCSFGPESEFQLAPGSRLPKWFSIPSGMSRDEVSVKLTYQVGLSGHSATLMLLGPNGQMLQKISGKLEGLKPIQLQQQFAGFPPGYPTFEIITINGMTDFVEHRRMEPIFYIVDDPDLLKELVAKKRKE